MADATNPKINEQLEALNTALEAIDTTIKNMTTETEGGEVE